MTAAELLFFRDHLNRIGQHRGLRIRVWARAARHGSSRIAICTKRTAQSILWRLGIDGWQRKPL